MHPSVLLVSKWPLACLAESSQDSKVLHVAARFGKRANAEMVVKTRTPGGVVSRGCPGFGPVEASIQVEFIMSGPDSGAQRPKLAI